MFQSMNKRFIFHSFRASVGMVVFFLIPPPTVLKKNLQKILSSSFSSKCRLMLRNKTQNIEDTRSKFLVPYCNNIDAIDVYIRKVVSEKEIKLKEFNFKVLHGILACNVNLKRWKIKEIDECDVCRLPQTIEHLLFTCRYVAPLWQIVDSVFDINVSFETILGVDDFCEYDNIVTLICFLIYKEWLILSLENKSRKSNIMFLWFKNELITRLRIFEKCTKFSVKEIANIDALIEYL